MNYKLEKISSMGINLGYIGALVLMNIFILSKENCNTLFL